MSQLTIHRSDAFGSLYDVLFSDYFQRASSAPARQTAAVRQVNRARVDVIDRGDQFEISVDLPGVKKQDIQVAVEGTRVAISAETKRESESKEGERVLQSERFVTSYARSFDLPVEVTEDGADARFEDGVLTLALPKRTPATSKRLTIK